MSFSLNYIDSFKKGQFDKTTECKERSKTNNIVSIFDGDVTTYIYEKTNELTIEELREFVVEEFCSGYDRCIATFSEDDGDISVYFEGVVDGEIDDIQLFCFEDEDGDKEYWEVFVGDKSELLCTSAFVSKEDVLKEYPYLRECSVGDDG
jgi:superfamily I DNA and RNA helicase